ncbi:DUF58 domain-containing protein [Luteimonas mephitis]|uniref:DUF58 domain-containing protein n=1 Tax=Luteimonas mephitis TaxID=83615 RepID=UPI003A934FE6
MSTSTPTHPDLIPADVRARLGTLRLAMRQPAAVQGYGVHHSRSRGAGLEFAQYRAYEPGDSLRQVDWKLYARSDRFFVREAERDSPLTAWLLLDASASMAQCDAARPGWSRLDAAKALAACTIELALRQGDRFGVIAAGGSGLHALPAGGGARHRDRCVLELQRLSASGAWPAQRLRPLWEGIHAGTLVIMLSDCFDDAVVALAERLAAARREVVVVQLLTAEERDFPFRGGHRFRDPETGDEVLGDGAAVRDGFIERFTAARAALARRFAASGIRHVEHVLDQPLDAPLRALFGAHRGAGA